MSSVDLRGFAYPLQALVQRKEWQVEERLRQLAAALQRLQQAQQECEELSAACSGHAEQARQAWHKRADPATYQRLLVYLAGQQEKTVQLQGRREALQLEHQRAQQDYLALQKQLEGLSRHRQDCQDEYAAGERTRQLAQADQDWAGRLHLPQARMSP
jgi:chromosome segregation ATPase